MADIVQKTQPWQEGEPLTVDNLNRIETNIAMINEEVSRTENRTFENITLTGETRITGTLNGTKIVLKAKE